MTRRKWSSTTARSAGDLSFVTSSAEPLANVSRLTGDPRHPAAAQAIREGRADAVSSRFADNDEIKARYGVV